MRAQLITTRLKPGTGTAEPDDQLRAAEQPGSGLVRTLVMRDQADSGQAYTLVVFESEDKARAREQDPRRQEALQAARANATSGGVSMTLTGFTTAPARRTAW